MFIFGHRESARSLVFEVR